MALQTKGRSYFLQRDTEGNSDNLISRTGAFHLKQQGVYFVRTVLPLDYYDKVLFTSIMVKEQRLIVGKGRGRHFKWLRSMIMKTSRAICESDLELVVSDLLLFSCYLPPPKSAPAWQNFELDFFSKIKNISNIILLSASDQVCWRKTFEMEDL